MMSVDVLDRPHAGADDARAMWRGSNDGIVWNAWMPLVSLDQQIPHYAFVQARILVDGAWLTSPVEIWE